ncbi:hypothetical protein Gbro_3645 [Gordonia bronchialis DSM 43247]|uniref:ESX secretion-associated protein EspG n=1 Tax=Gordonia bronchialis (strain ATCC 25592 / DSM 43247 / BCRC 13721 / JCM 3198 / KCTC 3076 / NBRC 16047 / NCTC 10667) TaxID=526226 RepID=D0L2D0_GORB4|nr:ESX secretion-associated protein EspG [Gordonia bronchialis]ACY22833.1 hypothetical protein Gbro_3645 [Gordonia bronchialis DSM 43247]STQ65774.1 ESX-1 secretion-associated protein EspG1 [Gordonia bronchialis]
MTMWTSTDRHTLMLDVAVLRGLGQRFGAQTWPVVLDIEGVLDIDDAAAARPALSHAELHQRIAETGLVCSDGEPTTLCDTVIRVLCAPERMIEMRTIADAGFRRICLARSGNDHVLAVRDGARIELSVVSPTGVGELGALLRARLPERAPCVFDAISHPAAELLDRLGRCRSGLDMTDALHAMGASPGDAMVVSAAFASCRVQTEIVAVAHDAGVLTQSSGAVAILDTDKGRIVSSPSKSPDGRVWTTLSPGSGHRIAQAIGLLIETLPDGRWFP